jgi:hypothetical protein
MTARTYLDIRDFGAMGAPNDDTVPIGVALALAEAGTYCTHRVYIPRGEWNTNVLPPILTTPTGRPGIEIFGDRCDRPADGGSSLNYIGPIVPLPAGQVDLGYNATPYTMLQLGAVQPGVYNTGSFNGNQGLTIRNLHFSATGNIPLVSGNGSYAGGVSFITDWRGGDVTLDHVWFECAQFGFWGVQSDVNNWSNLQAMYCAVAFCLNAESDQLNCTGAYTLCNGIGFLFNGSRGAKISGWRSVNDGCAYTSPLTVGTLLNSVAGDPNSDAGCSRSIALYSPWFEHSGLPASLGSFMQFGCHAENSIVVCDRNVVSVNGPNADLTIENPAISVRAANAGNTTNYFALVGNASGLSVTRPSNLHENSQGNLEAWFDVMPGCSPVLQLAPLSNTWWPLVPTGSTYQVVVK